MAIREVVKEITKVHGYKVTADYWSRVGRMIKNYGEDVMLEAVNQATPGSIPLTNMLNIIERKSQYILENGTGSIDDLANDILNLEE